ncbi:MAG: chemotaxis protein CheW [Wenzhouxiangellaceae bacterium]
MSEQEIRSVLIPASGGDLLLPNASVAEVVGLAEISPVPNAANWLVGTMLWHGWEIPLVNYGLLARTTESDAGDANRVAIIKALSAPARMPYMGFLCRGFPRLVTVTAASLVAIPDRTNVIGVLGHAILQDREVILPDLDRTSQLVAHAAFGALPITSSKLANSKID